MSSSYRGKSGNASVTASVSVSSSTNASPIEVTCSAAHGLVTGDRVFIKRHETNTAANGSWTITKTSATKFTLDGSTGNGVGVATGTVYPYNFANGTTHPDDGDAAAAASVTTPLESNLDRHAYLVERTGLYRLAAYSTFAPIAGGGPGTAWHTQNATTGAWATDTGANAVLSLFYLDVAPGDIVKVSFVTAAKTDVSSEAAFKIAYEIVEYGAAATGTPTGDVTGAIEISSPAASALSMPLVLVGETTGFMAANRGRKMYFYLQVFGITAGNKQYDLRGSWQFNSEVWRAN